MESRAAYDVVRSLATGSWAAVALMGLAMLFLRGYHQPVPVTAYLIELGAVAFAGAVELKARALE